MDPTSETSVAILPLEPDSVSLLLPMWRAYQEFYRVSDIDEAQNRRHVTEILNHPALGHIHLALASGVPVGFSTLYHTYASTRACKVAILNELFVEPRHRRAGIGRALLEHALGFTRQLGIRYVRWSTASSNTQAQRLYASYAEPTEWQVYSVDVSRRASIEPTSPPGPTGTAPGKA